MPDPPADDVPVVDGDPSARIDAVFLAQTHVLPADEPKLRLVGDRAALIKVHVVSETQGPAPTMRALLDVDDVQTELRLSGPDTLPAAIATEPGVVEHRFDDSFTAMIPAELVRPGLQITLLTGTSGQQALPSIAVGAPTEVVLTMFDVHYFEPSDRDYEPGWESEVWAKWPVAELQVRRIRDIVFTELVIPPRSDGGAPALRVTSRQEYLERSGLSQFERDFAGEWAALQWKGALQRAGGAARTSLYYVNVLGPSLGGLAGGYGGVGAGGNMGVVHHELGHALSLPHWAGRPDYPYVGTMHGIQSGGNPANPVHAGPTWGFDQREGQPVQGYDFPYFIPPTIQPNAIPTAISDVGKWKRDPMAGGGAGDQEEGFFFRTFSDHSMWQMQRYLERHVVVHDAQSGDYLAWNDGDGDYTDPVPNDGVTLPLQHDAEVISVMAAVSAASPDVNMVYPPIGPYTAGMIRLYDPSVAADRSAAAQGYCPADGCDLSLRITQGGKTFTRMLPAAWKPGANPRVRSSLTTRAVNLAATDGAVTAAQLLLTPEAQSAGLPSTPTVLDEWTP